MNTTLKERALVLLLKYVIAIIGFWVTFSVVLTVLPARAEDDLEFEKIASTGTADGRPFPLDSRSLLPQCRESAELRRKLSEYTFKTADQVDKLANERYPEVTGRRLSSDEIMSVTDLRVTDWGGYAWCVSVIRVDGKTQYPRLCNRLWIDAETGNVTAMLPKLRQAASNTDLPPTIADGNLLPMLVESHEQADRVKTLLKKIKVPFPESVLEHQRKRAASAAPIFGRVAVIGLFALGRDAEEFGKDGDLIWIVQEDAGGTWFYKEEWINSRNGATVEFTMKGR